MNPYELDYISNHILYQIDPQTYDIFIVSQEKSDFHMSLYEHEGILRALLNKQNRINKDFLEELYESSNDNSIYYILNYDQNEKYIFNFEILNKDPSYVTHVLESLKENKAQIINWIRKECKLKPESDFYENVQSFPRYTVPNIECHITQSGDTYKSTIRDVQITGLNIECDLSQNFEDESVVQFSIGKSDYSLKCTKVWESTDSDHHTKRAGLQIQFSTVKEFKLWKTFIMAMHLRSKKEPNT